MRDRFRSRFDAEAEPMAVMGNLVDVMLVFACGLIAALLASSPELQRSLDPDVRDIRRGRELSRLPDAAQEGGTGMESVGRVYRDRDTGKLILIGD